MVQDPVSVEQTMDEVLLSKYVHRVEMTFDGFDFPNAGQKVLSVCFLR